MDDNELREKLKAFNVKIGPITDTTRILYRRKLEKLINDQSLNSSSKTPILPSRSLELKPSKPSLLRSFTEVKSTTLSLSKPEKSNTENVNSRTSLILSPSKLPQNASVPAPNASPKNRISSFYYINTDSDDGDPEFLTKSRTSYKQKQASESNTYKTPDRYAWLKNWWLQSAESRERRIFKSPIRTQKPSTDNNWIGLSDYSDNETPLSSRDISISTSPHLLRTPSRQISYGGVNKPYSTSESSFLYNTRSLLSNIKNLIFNYFHIILASIFIIAIGALLAYEFNDPYDKVIKNYAFNKLICKPDKFEHSSIKISQCLNSLKMPRIRELTGQLFEILSRISGNHYCNSHELNPVLEIDQAKIHLNQYLAERYMQTMSDEDWESVLFLITRLGPDHVFIICYDRFHNWIHPHNATVDVYKIESTRPYYSGRCRLQLLFHQIIDFGFLIGKFILYATVLVSIFYGVYKLILRKQEANKNKLERVVDMVNYVINSLQQRYYDSQNDITDSIPPWMTIRDLVTRLKERFDGQSRLVQGNLSVEKLWSVVSYHILQNETCVAVENILGVGEVWSWHGGTGWQGSALHNDSVSRKAPFSVPPTECLKIRNMCSFEGLDEYRKDRVKLELFKKIKHCGGILHIGISCNSDQPIVYICCENPEVAGKVFNSVNANYFDGKLVMARFLKYDKYRLRFPQVNEVRKPLTENDFY